jgi:serine/threonine-protein kinase
MTTLVETTPARQTAEISDPLIGSAIGGFRVERRLGVGMSSTVYLARELTTGRTVALKVLDASFARSVAHERRFLREARIAARLDHPNVARVFAFGRDESTGAVFFIAVEYVNGGTLGDHLAERGTLDVAETIHLARQVARALAHIRGHGIVHRDIKPENLLVSLDGTIQLADFGVALDVRPGVDADLGGAPGTPRYMAPEQLDGSPVDYRADLYAFGVTLHVALTGAAPFGDKKGVDLREAKTTLEAMSSLYSSDVPPELVRLVARLIRRRPEERPQSTLEVLAALSSVAQPPTASGSMRYAA